jgi:hypothetical protein
MRRYAPGAVTLGALFLSLCGLSAAPVPTHLMPKEPPCFYPTEVGTTWVYDHGDAEETITISEVEDKDGGKLITTEYVRANGRSHHMTQLVTAKGVFLVAEHGRTYPMPWCIFKLPHKVGDTWKTEGHCKDMKSCPAEKLKLPIGELTAARAEWDLGNRTAVYWYVQGIGLVGMAVGDDVKYKQLKSFTRGGR